MFNEALFETNKFFLKNIIYKHDSHFEFKMDNQVKNSLF
jgi:hypothetical protein